MRWSIFVSWPKTDGLLNTSLQPNSRKTLCCTGFLIDNLMFAYLCLWSSWLCVHLARAGADDGSAVRASIVPLSRKPELAQPGPAAAARGPRRAPGKTDRPNLPRQRLPLKRRIRHPETRPRPSCKWWAWSMKRPGAVSHQGRAEQQQEPGTPPQRAGQESLINTRACQGNMQDKLLASQIARQW